jgi:hypothetical protein
MRQFLIRISRKLFGWPPAPATFVEKKNLIWHTGREFGVKVFIETGTFRGEMIDAQREHFQKLISIELNEELFQAARLKYASAPQIQLHQGDSGIKLKEAVREVNEPVLFWLDAHYSWGNTAGGNEAAPIIRELTCLTSRSKLNDVILIDDARLFGLKGDYPRLEVIREFAARHWPRHVFAIKSDVICILPSQGMPG